MGRLNNKVAIITGGGTGIGEAVCHKFAQEGASVLVCGLPSDPVEDVAAAIRERGGDAISFAQDVADENHAAACIKAAIDQWGKLDILVSNSGVQLAAAETSNYPIAAFDETISKNIRSVFLMTRFALPHLVRSAGNIIATGSEAGTLGMAGNTAFGASKGWIHAFIKGVAAEQARFGVRANCVCPGPIDPSWTHRSPGAVQPGPDATGTPMGRRGTPDEVANVFAFLASDMASYVTGALWTVDGGTIISKGPFKPEPDSESGESGG